MNYITPGIFMVERDFSSYVPQTYKALWIKFLIDNNYIKPTIISNEQQLMEFMSDRK